MKRKDVGLLVLRLTTGGLMAGHGAQKLFGAFGGHGLEGTKGFMESLGLRPASRWAALAGLSEFGGGVLTALGLLNPLGPIGIISAMTMAARTAHRGKPIWGTAGGAELPVTNISAALALALAGPGRYSLDNALGLRLPQPLVGLAAAGAAGGVYLGLTQAQAAATEAKSDEPAQAETPREQEQPGRDEQQAEPSPDLAEALAF